MITNSMTLNSTTDAQNWAEQYGLYDQTQIDNLATWIWNNKPAVGCSYDEFLEAHGETLANLGKYWNILDGE